MQRPTGSEELSAEDGPHHGVQSLAGASGQLPRVLVRQASWTGDVDLGYSTAGVYILPNMCTFCVGIIRASRRKLKDFRGFLD